jgi:hypothetical protein
MSAAQLPVVAVAVESAVSPSTTPNEYSRTPTEALLRAEVHLQRAAQGYAQASAELRRAHEELEKARPALGGEARANVVALGAQLTLRRTEAGARGEAFVLWAQSVGGWASTALPLEGALPAAVAAEEGGAA